MPKFQINLQKIKSTIKSFSFLVIVFFTLAKIFIGVVELPHMVQNSTNIPYLLISFLFTLASVGCKIFKHKLTILPSILPSQKQSFLLWVIAIILMVFNWSLADNLKWNIFQKILLVLCLFLTIFLITLFHDPKFISKFQFIAFEVIFAVEILAVALKTVGFIKDHSESPDKDIVLLNLTTQIALMILMMDYLEKAYREHKKEEIEDDMSRLQNQMIFVNRTRKSSKTNPTSQ